MTLNIRALAVLLGVVAICAGAAAQEPKVKITESMPWLDVTHNGQKVRIQRIQDTGHKVIDDFAKTSRPCPPFCIHPMQAAPGVATIGELELLEFIARDVKAGTGVLVDARLPEFHKAETIPTAINIPFSLVKSDNPHMDGILTALGAQKGANGKWDFSRAKTLTLFCNGLWCDQSPRAIQGFLAFGYPADKLRYYRDGMQMWRLLGLTTVVPTRPM
ncbi:MAG: rhodanese-like domain-containing protein [Betaproteobacteria bacterium]|nr:rhodanese-like domain-containing protein [Betaproteobacteria bacterium]